MIVLLTINIFEVYTKAKIAKEVQSNLLLVLSQASREIKSSKNIYYPTSCFNAGDIKPVCASGIKRQLTLVSDNNLPPNESETYVDIYLDSGQVYLKKEGLNPVALTTDKVIITELRFEDIFPSIQILIKGEYANPLRPKLQTSISLTSSASFRSY